MIGCTRTYKCTEDDEKPPLTESQTALRKQQMDSVQCGYLSHCKSNDNKKLSCRRETVRCFVSLTILLNHSMSLNVIPN